jgi:diaminopimelate decarboxylase
VEPHLQPSYPLSASEPALAMATPSPEASPQAVPESPLAHLGIPQGVLPDSFRLAPNGEATLGGVSLETLANSYGTPLYVLDGDTIRNQARQYVDNLKKHYPGSALVVFAAKANLSLGLCRLLEQEGLGLDVVSGGELYTAIQAGFPMDRVIFNGNNKSRDELEMAIYHQVGRIVVDNEYELGLIHEIASRKQARVNVLLRIAPGIECHTHDYLKTATEDNKFGFHLAMLGPMLERCLTLYPETITVRGLHTHIGSQIFELAAYEDLIEILLNIYYNIRDAFKLTLDELDMGGGLGIMYTGKDDPPSIDALIQRASSRLQEYARRINFPLPKLYLEPGRSLVATAGTTLYTVGSQKRVPNGRTFIAVDGGMGDNIRPALYQAEYSAVVINKLYTPPSEWVTLVGKYCESGDVLIRNFAAPPLEAGDRILVFGTGAYNYTMSSNYNRIPRPAMVLVGNGSASLLVRRESYDDILARDVIPAPLARADYGS